ncbi:coiled-coil domain-containing protein [Spirillospora sp. CA-294931]|uniref:coiled-coil domain-containing protein n=1 Tax=Spirillospora sp. CA-294931 TaxID=3240042 RepID=UPI003D942C45
MAPSNAGVQYEPKDVKKELAALQKRAERLSKEYRGELISLEQAKRAAQRANDDAARLEQEYETARGAVSKLAASSYMTGRMETIPIITDGDPSAAIRDVTVVEHMARNNGRRIQNLQALALQAERSKQQARTKLADVRKEIDDLESQRARVKKLLAKYKPENPVKPGPGRPDGASGTKSPIIGNSMTSRMRTALQAIDGKFGPFPAVGCARPGDAQDHGQGKACDFMESTGGKLPSTSARNHGDQVAQYVINNASSLGIKYVIWRQRIYDMRSSGGWRAMEDRGSVTQNHFDHVHVSVL